MRSSHPVRRMIACSPPCRQRSSRAAQRGAPSAAMLMFVVAAYERPRSAPACRCRLFMPSARRHFDIPATLIFRLILCHYYFHYYY